MNEVILIVLDKTRGQNKLFLIAVSTLILKIKLSGKNEQEIAVYSSLHAFLNLYKRIKVDITWQMLLIDSFEVC